jgi:uncharacterized cupredoxin-like copper-binding protein
MKVGSSVSIRFLLGLAIAGLALAACVPSTATTWSYAPPAGTPPASAAPGASGLPAASAPPAASPGMSAMPGMSSAPSAAASGGPAASGAPAANTIELVETATLQITDPAGKQVASIPVRKGQTYHFKITNTAGFTHNFYVGKVDDLAARNMANLTGTPDFTSGTQEFDYTFTETQGLGFGCLVPGHYEAGMKGTFDVQS